MISELDVLYLVGERLDASALPFMLTGSFAMAYYTTPRMTRDLDIVVALGEQDADTVVAAFREDFYIDRDDVRIAIASLRLFNLMHFASGIKVDFIVRKYSPYRQIEFARRLKVTLAGVDTWIATREDLILSKLVWARDAASELQLRDVAQLLAGPVDVDYLQHWASDLGVADSLLQLKP